MEKALLKEKLVIDRACKQAIPLIIYHSLFLIALMILTPILIWIWFPIGSNHLLAFPYSVIWLSLTSLFVAMWVLSRNIWHLFTRWFLIDDPVLIIGHDGIYIGKLPLVIGEIVISWREIETLSAQHISSQTFLDIRLKSSKQYFSHLPQWKRWAIRFASWPQKSSLVILQKWMEQPVHDTLQQIRLRYSEELNDYKIELRI